MPGCPYSQSHQPINHQLVKLDLFYKVNVLPHLVLVPHLFDFLQRALVPLCLVQLSSTEFSDCLLHRMLRVSVLKEFPDYGERADMKDSL